MTKTIEVPVTFVSSPHKAEEVQIYHRLRNITGDVNDYPVFRVKKEILDWNTSHRSGVGNVLAGIFDVHADGEIFLVPAKIVSTAVQTFFHQHADREKWKHAFIVGAPYETAQTNAILEIFPDPRLMFIAPSQNGTPKHLEQSIADAAARFSDNRGWAFKEVPHDAGTEVKVRQLLQLADIDDSLREEWLKLCDGKNSAHARARSGAPQSYPTPRVTSALHE